MLVTGKVDNNEEEVNDEDVNEENDETVNEDMNKVSRRQPKNGAPATGDGVSHRKVPWVNGLFPKNGNQSFLFIITIFKEPFSVIGRILPGLDRDSQPWDCPLKWHFHA